MKKLSACRAAALLAAAVVAAPTWAAMAYTDWGSVTSLEGGWTVDSMSVAHSAPLVNPDFCSVTNAGYATNPADSGHSLFHTMLLGAFLNRKETRMLISGCAFNKPRVISVHIR